MLRRRALCKNEDTTDWIIILEEFRMKLEDMGSGMTDDALNSLTNDYELQMVLLEKIIGNKENLL
jgi:hypothetical protein